MRATALPVNWKHNASGSPVEAGLVFDYIWQDLDAPANDFVEIFLRTIAYVPSELARRHGSASV